MAGINQEELAEYRRNRVLLDPYVEWAAGEGVPVIEDFAVDLLTAPTKAWPRFGCDGAIINLKGRGNYCSIFLFELRPGAKSEPQRHLYEEVFYVLSGHGSTTIETASGRRHTFEWGPKSLFAIPLNARFQHFNGSGAETARLASTNNLCLMLNLYHSERFIFRNSSSFAEREGADGFFTGEGELTPVRNNRMLWETNFVPDLGSFELASCETRGAGSTNMLFVLADGSMGAHCSEMPVGTYKKAHRHGPGLHIFLVHGTGYSLLWYQDDQDFVRVNWRHGMAFAPPHHMFHQHFDTSLQPARYLAVGFGSKRYPVVQLRRAGSEDNRSDLSIKQGGRQVEYEDQDPRIHQMWLNEIGKTGVASKMGKHFAGEAMLQTATASGEK